jgi:hypothetical protein
MAGQLTDAGRKAEDRGQRVEGRALSDAPGSREAFGVRASLAPLSLTNQTVTFAPSATNLDPERTTETCRDCEKGSGRSVVTFD